MEQAIKKGIEQYRAAYETLSPAIEAGIEKYRKGNFRIEVTRSDGTPLSVTVRTVQKKHAFDFGTSALMLGAMGDKEEAYREAITNLFNLVTTTFCWSVTETEPQKYRFAEGSEEIYRRPPADRVLRFAEENGMKAKGQPLFCGRWCPDWVEKDLDTLKARWTDYVKEVAKRYDGKYRIFDVTNESYQTNGTWKNMSWLPITNGELVEWMLKTAGEIFSENCVMERNETTRVNYGTYADIYYEENKALTEKKVRLDAIGFQFHFFSGQSCVENHLLGEAGLQSIFDTYQKMSTLGVPLYITEITIPSVYEGMSAEEGESLQAEILEKLYKLWFSIPRMRGIIYWNIKEGDAWKNEGDCRGCLVDEYLRKKKSYCVLEWLLKKEWNTALTAQSDENGTVSFRGFYGEYEITATDERGDARTFRHTFEKDNDVLKIVLP